MKNCTVLYIPVKLKGYPVQYGHSDIIIIIIPHPQHVPMCAQNTAKPCLLEHRQRPFGVILTIHSSMIFLNE